MREEKSRRRKKAKDSTDILDFYPKVKLFCIKKSNTAPPRSHTGRKATAQKQIIGRPIEIREEGPLAIYFHNRETNNTHSGNHACRWAGSLRQILGDFPKSYGASQRI
jgi:hypothetical protein